MWLTLIIIQLISPVVVEYQMHFVAEEFLSTSLDIRVKTHLNKCISNNYLDTYFYFL